MELFVSRVSTETTKASFPFFKSTSFQQALEATRVGIINTPSVVRASLVLNKLKTSALFRLVRNTCRHGQSERKSGNTVARKSPLSVTSPFTSSSVSVSAFTNVK